MGPLCSYETSLAPLTPPSLGAGATVCGGLWITEETPDMPHAVALFAAASEDQGPGNTIRIVLVASLLGVALLAWFLLRGYRNDDNND